VAITRFLKYDKETEQLVDRMNPSGTKLKPKLAIAMLFGDPIFAQFATIFEFKKAFPNEQSCIDWARITRWRGGDMCPYCERHRIYYFADRKTFKCRDCRQIFSIKVGTIFHDSKLPLRKWFMAIWFINHNNPKGTPSTVLAKFLGVTQKTAWLVLERLRSVQDV
jgi:transposase-like protein